MKRRKYRQKLGTKKQTTYLIKHKGKIVAGGFTFDSAVKLAKGRAAWERQDYQVYKEVIVLETLETEEFLVSEIYFKDYPVPKPRKPLLRLTYEHDLSF